MRGVSSAASGQGGALSSLGNYAGGAGNALGVLGGVQQGGVGGYAGAGVNAAQLANRMGAFGQNSAASQGIGDASNVLGIYSGLKQGGVSGDTGAAVNAAQLGAHVGAFGSASGSIGNYAGMAAVPLDLYNEIKGWQSGATGSDALAGAETGAAVGSVILPGFGTLIGGALGGAAGALSSAFGGGRVDPENTSFEGYKDAYNKALQQGGQQAADQVAASVQDPYLPLAGYFDLRSNQVGPNNPLYSTYGRMGEQKFTNDLVSQLSAAQKSGVIKPGESTSQAYNDVVTPWLNSMGTWQDPNKQALQGAIEQMTAQDLSGQAGTDWKAIGGDSPFASLSPTQASKPVVRKTMNGQTMLAADGGSISAKLRKLYAGSFANRKRHYDDGGGVDYFTPTTDTSYQYDPELALPDYSPTALDSSLGETGLQDPFLNGSSVSETSQASNSLNDSSFAPGGALSGLGSLLGVSNLGQFVKQYGALAPLLSAALGGNKAASAPATPAGYGTIPSIPTPANPRSYTQPNVANWYTYGQGPEQSFFSNNQLPTVPGMSPAQSTPPTAPAAAPSTGTPNVNMQPLVGLQPRAVMAQGGSFDSTQGDDYVSDPGHGDGTSDGIDAKLSGGEYVMDAGTVATLGNGSNEAGARALDQLRARVRKHAGKQLVKGKQFMKAKAPQTYLRGGK